MELKTSYQYTYFIYPFAIKEKNYKKYVINLINNKKFKLKMFDAFKDVELYKYFVPSIKEKMFQDFSFTAEKMSSINKLSKSQKLKQLLKQKCIIFEYDLPNQISGKTGDKDGIFFSIPKIELICFDTGICFLNIKTTLTDTEEFSDIINFNYKFENINFENNNIKKLKNIKIQTDMFDTMSQFLGIVEKITGKKINSKDLNIDKNMFLIYSYVCVKSNYWNEKKGFENIENEFIKLAEVKPNDVNINIEYDKLSIISNASYMKLRANSKSVALICSEADQYNYTHLPEIYENQYLYTYILALHQKFYLTRINKKLKTNPRIAIKEFFKFCNEIWISEITGDSFGQKLYKRFKEKLNIEEIFNEIKNKYDIYYKELRVEKNERINKFVVIIMLLCLLTGLANLSAWMFIK